MGLGFRLRQREGLQFLKFAAVGAVNTVVHYVIFLGLYRLGHVHLLLATSLGYLGGMVNSYLMNRSFTFEVSGKRNVGEIYRFFIVNIIALLCNAGALHVLVDVLGIVAEVAQVLSIAFSLGVNFLGNRFWTFAEEERTNDRE